MYTLKDISAKLGISLTVFRYWIKKNQKDCEDNIYDFNFSELIEKVKIRKKYPSKFAVREYAQYIVLDLEEFIEQYNRYTNFVENMKKRRGKGKWFWSVSAIECYQANMNCEKCFNKKICSSVILNPQDEPPMKTTVKLLLSKLGKPYLF